MKIYATNKARLKNIHRTRNTPKYNNLDVAHNNSHINKVIKNSLEIAKTIWLNSRSFIGPGAYPLLFDKNLQAKYSYWAIIDYTKIPQQNK